MLDLSLPAVIGVFLLAAAVIGLAGPRLTRLADVLADRTGLGEAIAGAVLLGATTSLPGVVTSITAASSGNVDLAAANALGGIAAQTVFLAVADIFHRRANLEHAAASSANLMQATLLVLLLSIPVLTVFTPTFSIAGISPASIVLLVVYVAGVRLAMREKNDAQWIPKRTPETRIETVEPESGAAGSPLRLAGEFIVLMVVTGAAGYVVALTGVEIAGRTGLGETVVGTLMTATATSLPELVTTVAAVRQGALHLAVGGIIGGNTFDVLFLSASDVAYRDGSIYHAISGETIFWAVVGILMTAIMLLGLVRREKHGFANIGFESIFLILVYAGAVAITTLPFIGAGS